MQAPSDPATISPLQLLLELMREKWRDDKKEAAANLAKIAAPYVHARARPESPDKPVSEMTDEELGWTEEDNAPLGDSDE